jgi:hypothetical protein
MSLERKDVRFKLAPELHQALSVLAEVAQMDIGEFVEDIVEHEVRKQVHGATVIAERTARLGISGNFSGKAGRSRE